MPGLAIFMEYEYSKYHGTLKNIRHNLGKPLVENSLFFGLSLIV